MLKTYMTFVFRYRIKFGFSGLLSVSTSRRESIQNEVMVLNFSCFQL